MTLIPGNIYRFFCGFLVFVFLLFYSSVYVFGQKHPKIGLVLSGGGAKGMAHIGILKALEEAGITPDFITGTSMGSIMGGLYASGYSADEIKAIALSADWDQLLTNKLKQNEVVYEEKDYYNRYINEINLNGLNPELPKGLIEGQKLSMLLTKLTRPVMNIKDFSKLPIPFACIAADIENGDRVVLNKGSLARSMRASMAIPSVFTPVLINDRLLVDGGLVHNFPAEELIEMGADYIIGVFVGTNLLKKEEIGSPVSVLTQSAFILGSFDNDKQRTLIDLLIEPDLTGLSSGDFHKAAEIIEAGERAGRIYLEQFKALKDSLTAAGLVNRKVVKPVVSDTIHLSAVKVINNAIVPADFIENRLGLEADSYVFIEDLEKAITDLYGTGYFTKILYEINDSQGGSEITVDVTELPEGKIRAALQYDNETKVALLLNITYRNLLFNDSRIMLEGEISENPLVDANYLKYFGEGHKFGFTGGYYFRNSQVPDIRNNNVEGLYAYNYNRFYAGFHSSHNINRILQLLYSYEEASLVPKVVSGDVLIDKYRFSGHNFELKYDFDNLDSRYFPVKGNNYGFLLKYNTGSKLKADIQLADTLDPINVEVDNNGSFLTKIYHRILIPAGKKLTFGMLNSISFDFFPEEDSVASATRFLNQNYIGGFRKLAPNIMPFWGADPLTYYSENLFYNELMVQFEPKRNLYLQLVSQYFYANPFGSVLPSVKDNPYNLGGKQFLFGGGATIGYRSPIGPISFSVGKGNTSADFQYFINIGFYFDRD